MYLVSNWQNANFATFPAISELIFRQALHLRVVLRSVVTVTVSQRSMYELREQVTNVIRCVCALVSQFVR